MTDDSDSNTSRRMLLGGQVMLYGSNEAAWRWPAANPNAYVDLDLMTEAAQTAERGGLEFLFIADHPAMRGDMTHNSPSATLDPIIISTELMRNTSNIGLVITQSTTFNFPYTVARQLKVLDLISNGRMGWNAITTNDPQIAANYGSGIEDRPERYGRAHEFVQLVQALWGSFGEDALELNQETGVFARGSQIQPINLGGQYVASRGPLPIPASPQGQPIIFQAGGGNEALELAGNYASGVYSMAVDIPTGRAHREALRAAAERAGRSPDDVRLFMGITTTIADTYEEAMARRTALLDLVADTIPQKLQQLAAMVSVPIGPTTMHEPLDETSRAALMPAPYGLHSERAVALLRDGLSPYDVLLHGVTDFHTTLLGSPAEVADQMQHLFEGGASDGFIIVPDVIADGLPAFVDQVVPILTERGLFSQQYEGSTLREHFGVPKQYGR